MTQRTRRDIIRQYAMSWFDLFGAEGKPRPLTQLTMMLCYHYRRAEARTAYNMFTEDEKVQAMLEVNLIYEGMDRAKTMVEKEYAR